MVLLILVSVPQSDSLKPMQNLLFQERLSFTSNAMQETMGFIDLSSQKETST
jgi:hypothetical protein